MRDKHDKSNDNLLRTPAARRQAAYAERQRAAGRRQRAIWLTDDEYQAVQALVGSLRPSESV